VAQLDSNTTKGHFAVFWPKYQGKEMRNTANSKYKISTLYHAYIYSICFRSAVHEILPLVCGINRSSRTSAELGGAVTPFAGFLVSFSAVLHTSSLPILPLSVFFPRPCGVAWSAYIRLNRCGIMQYAFCNSICIDIMFKHQNWQGRN